MPTLPDESDPDHVAPVQAVQRLAITSPLRIVGASRRGDRHLRAGTDREDALAVHLDERTGGSVWFCAAIADGVGSRPLARVGSQVVVRAFVDECIRETHDAPPRPADLRALLSRAAWAALRALAHEAQRRDVPCADLGTTLLGWVGIPWPTSGLALGLFQAGNGLIASTTDDGRLVPLIDPGDESDEGIHDLCSQHVQDTWDERRIQQINLDPAPRALVMMTDGIADDLLPLYEKSPILCAELRPLEHTPDASAALLEILSYTKRGSADDRTLVCALRPSSRPDDP